MKTIGEYIQGKPEEIGWSVLVYFLKMQLRDFVETRNLENAAIRELIQLDGYWLPSTTKSLSSFYIFDAFIDFVIAMFICFIAATIVNILILSKINILDVPLLGVCGFLMYTSLILYYATQSLDSFYRANLKRIWGQ